MKLPLPSAAAVVFTSFGDGVAIAEPSLVDSSTPMVHAHDGHLLSYDGSMDRVAG